MAAKTLTPVRLVTTIRTGSCPEGYVTQDRILRPLTKAERKAGKPDELKEWYATYGSVHPRRNPHRRQPDKVRPPRPEPVPNDPPKEVQDEVYKEIGGYEGPTLLIHGSADRIVSISYSEKAAKLYPNCTYHVVADGQHGFRGKHDREAVQVLTEFMKLD